MTSRFWKEFKYFRWQYKNGYPRQKQDERRATLMRRVQCWELKHYSWEQCLNAAGAFFRMLRIRGGDDGLTEFADMLFVRTGRGETTFEEIMEAIWRLRSRSK